jgi:outer membrane lipoprotein SlyB
VSKFNFNRCVAAAICLMTSAAWADSLELKNGSLINGEFVGGTETEISFQVASSVQKYGISDVASIKFSSDVSVNDTTPRPLSPRPVEPIRAPDTQSSNVTVPAGTRVSVRTIDSIDSTKNHPGDRFQASLEEPLTVDGVVIAPKGANVYGRLAESKKSGTFTGKSELQLELTGIVVNGRTVPVVTGEYELKGKSRGASTAKRSIGGAAVGGIIGAIAGGGRGAGIGAAAGGGAGAGSEIITKGDQVKVPSETLLEFTLQQEATIPGQRS